MKACSLFICIICYIYRYTSIEIKSELKNILQYGYGITYKYEAMLWHSFDRFYVIKKFILPTTSDMNFLKFNSKEVVNIWEKEIPDTIIEKKNVF